MRNGTRILAAAIAAVCSGCAPTVTSVMFVSPPPPPQSATHPIQLYKDTRPECPYQEVGRVSVQEGDGSGSTDKLTETLRQRAREMGGDGITDFTLGVVNQGGVVVGASVIADNHKTVSGTVIRFRDSTCTH